MMTVEVIFARLDLPVERSILVKFKTIEITGFISIMRRACPNSCIGISAQQYQLIFLVLAFPVRSCFVICWSGIYKLSIVEQLNIFSNRRNSQRLARRVPQEEQFFDNDYDDYESYRTEYREPQRLDIRNVSPFEDRESTPNSYDEFSRSDDYAEYYDDDNFDLEPTGGNFWSNPVGKTDASPLDRAKPRQRRSALDAEYEYRERTRFRNNMGGTQRPPIVLKELYDRLFWYGFDSSEGTAPGDSTMFGGTRGKFNGLAFLQDAERNFGSPTKQDDDDELFDFLDDPKDKLSRVSRRQPRPRSRRQRPNTSRFDDEYDGYEANLEDEDLDEYNTMAPPKANDLQTRSRQRIRRQGRPVDRVEKDYIDQAPPRPRRNRFQEPRGVGLSGWIEKFMGLDAEQRELLAREYDLRMGLVPRDSTVPLRKDVQDDNFQEMDNVYEMEDVYDVQIKPSKADSPKEVSTRRSSSTRDEAQELVDRMFEQKKQEAIAQQQATTAKKERTMTWEERAEAMERIPPPGLEGWGPNGPLPPGVDARRQAVLDAQQEIREANELVAELRELAKEVAEDVKACRA